MTDGGDATFRRGGAAAFRGTGKHLARASRQDGIGIAPLPCAFGQQLHPQLLLEGVELRELPLERLVSLQDVVEPAVELP